MAEIVTYGIAIACAIILMVSATWAAKRGNGHEDQGGQ